MRCIFVIIGSLLIMISTSFATTEQRAQQILNQLLKVAKASQTKLKVRNDSRINAEYEGFDQIYINTGTLILDENTVAFILGHEIGHKMYGHRFSTYNNELQADAYGAYIMQKAGYNRCQGVMILKKFKGGATHPNGMYRYNKVKC